MRDRFGARDPRSLMLRFHTQTAGVQLTAQQPEVNLVRVTLQALGAVLGGTQSLHTNSFDEAIALPTAKAARLALRTQQVLAHETDLTKTVDPFAGSYAVESLTDDVEAATRSLMAAVAERGGAVAAIEQGFQKLEIERAAYAVAGAIDAGERVVVGVNRFVLDQEDPYEPLRVDPAIEAAQTARLADLRTRRDAAAVKPPWRACAPLLPGPTTCCRRSRPRWPRTPPWARSATPSARSGAPTSPRSASSPMAGSGPVVRGPVGVASRDETTDGAKEHGGPDPEDVAGGGVGRPGAGGHGLRGHGRPAR